MLCRSTLVQLRHASSFVLVSEPTLAVGAKYYETKYLAAVRRNHPRRVRHLLHPFISMRGYIMKVAVLVMNGKEIQHVTTTT